MKVFLLDADVIIWCAENSKLDSLFKGKKIRIPKKIFEEVKYKEDPETKERKTIQFQKYIKEGSLEVVDNPYTKEMKKVRDTYKECSQLAQLDDGESECIALLMKNYEYRFCTGDRTAMKVLGFWQLSEQTISLEELIGRVRDIRDDFTKEYMKKYLKIGSILRLQYGSDL